MAVSLAGLLNGLPHYRQLRGAPMCIGVGLCVFRPWWIIDPQSHPDTRCPLTCPVIPVMWGQRWVYAIHVIPRCRMCVMHVGAPEAWGTGGSSPYQQPVIRKHTYRAQEIC